MSQYCYMFSTLLLLIAFLLWKHRARRGYIFWWERRRMEIERVEMEARLTGHGFEATDEIKSRLKKVHEQHAAISRRKTETHREFAATVRRSLLQMGFFGGTNDHAEQQSPKYR